MRTNEERIAAMHERTKELKHRDRMLKRQIIQGVSIAACLMLVVIMGVLMPRISEKAVTVNTAGSMNASIFSSGGAFGYVVIAVLAFLIGVLVTIFCYRLKQIQEYKDKEDSL